VLLQGLLVFGCHECWLLKIAAFLFSFFSQEGDTLPSSPCIKKLASKKRIAGSGDKFVCCCIYATTDKFIPGSSNAAYFVKPCSKA
jgi:hypothetical protein